VRHNLRIDRGRHFSAVWKVHVATVPALWANSAHRRHGSVLLFCRDLSPSLRLLLGVDNLWCDTRTEQSAQKFVLWAGHVLQNRAAFEVSCCFASRLSLSSPVAHAC